MSDEIKPGLYTNGKTVVSIVGTWAGKVEYISEMPSRDKCNRCTYAEFRRRYPYRVTGVEVEDER
jgi:hypothetical protein